MCIVAFLLCPGNVRADDAEQRLASEVVRIETLLGRGRARQAIAALEALEIRAPGRAEIIALHRRALGAAPSARQRASLLRACETPTDRRAVLECARVLAEAGRFDAALDAATRGASHYDPASSAALAEIAVLAEDAGLRTHAASAAERAYAFAPDDPARVLLAAHHRIESGQPTAASGLLEPLLVAQPELDAARALAALAATLAGDHPRAIAHRQARLARCAIDQRASCLVDLATAQLYGRRFDEAIETATLATAAACPDDPLPHRVLGLALVRRGREEEARRAFDESLRRAPDPVTRALRRALQTP